MRGKRALTIVIAGTAAFAAVAGGYCASGQPGVGSAVLPTHAGLSVSFSTSSWVGGQTVNATVTNIGPTISTRRVDIPWTITPTSVWSGVNQSTAGHLVVSNVNWNGKLPTGASTTMPVAMPVALPAALHANFKVAPYVDMAGWPTPNLASIKAATGVSTFSLAFVTSAGGCVPAWGGYPSLGLNSSDSQLAAMNSSIAGLRAAGGNVLISFGGASGSELAQTCTDVLALTAAYQATVDKYRLTRIDFDIEGAAQTDHAANLRRGKAVAALQTAMASSGKNLTVTFTLPVLESGLTVDGLGVLKDTATGGGRVDLVNVMAMDYGGANSAMGQAAINAGTKTAAQLGFLYPGLTSAERLGRIGVTPMIGENDVPAEIFTVNDAKKVAAWAKANGVGEISWWSATRDSPCANNAAFASPTCSGTTNPAWAYALGFTTK